MRQLPLLDGRSLVETDVTLAEMRSLLLLYNSPEQTLLLPPSTAHRPESAPAKDTAPTPAQTHQHVKPSFWKKKTKTPRWLQPLTHKSVDANTLAIVDASDGSNDVVEEDL